MENKKRNEISPLGDSVEMTKSMLIGSFVFYVLVSIEVLAEEIEDPFGEDDNDLPTDSLSDKIRVNTIEIFEQ